MIGWIARRSAASRSSEARKHAPFEPGPPACRRRVGPAGALAEHGRSRRCANRSFSVAALASLLLAPGLEKLPDSGGKFRHDRRSLNDPGLEQSFPTAIGVDQRVSCTRHFLGIYGYHRIKLAAFLGSSIRKPRLNAAASMQFPHHLAESQPHKDAILCACLLCQKLRGNLPSSQGFLTNRFKVYRSSHKIGKIRKKRRIHYKSSNSSLILCRGAPDNSLSIKLDRNVGKFYLTRLQWV